MRWAMVTADVPKRAAARKDIYDQTAFALPEDFYDYIAAKTTGFTLDNLARFAKKDKALLTESPGTAASDDLRFFDDQQAVTLDDGALRKLLPKNVSDARAAAGGHLVALRFDKMKRIGFFSLRTAKFHYWIKYSDPGVVFGCGGRMAVVFSPRDNTITVHDLVDGKEIASKPNPFPGPLKLIEFAPNRSNRAVVVYASNDNASSACQWSTLDLPALSRISASTRVMRSAFSDVTYGDNLAVRVSEDLHRVVAWLPGGSPETFMSCRLEDGGFSGGSRIEKSYGWLAPSADGKKYFTHGGMIDAEGNFSSRRNTKLACFPIIGMPDQFLLYSASTKTYRQLTLASVVQGPPVKAEGPDLSFKSTGAFTADRQIIASGPAGRFAVIAPDEPAIYIYALPKP
jgi:hypothetical protein